jgi:hypothetical protein
MVLGISEVESNRRKECKRSAPRTERKAMSLDYFLSANYYAKCSEGYNNLPYPYPDPNHQPKKIELCILLKCNLKT